MPENASRAGALYDQFEDEPRVADWGGDELFTRMPRPRAVDDAPPPRFRPQLVTSPAAAPVPERALTLVAPADHGGDDGRRGADDRRRGDDPSAAEDLRSAQVALDDRPVSRRRSTPRSGEQAMLERAERLGISLVDPDSFTDLTTGRRTKVITGHPEGAPRPLPLARTDRHRRASQTTVEWIGPRPERLVGWAFALGLVLILIAILTA
jgi:hypothetical protein